MLTRSEKAKKLDQGELSEAEIMVFRNELYDSIFWDLYGVMSLNIEQLDDTWQLIYACNELIDNKYAYTPSTELSRYEKQQTFIDDGINSEHYRKWCNRYLQKQEKRIEDEIELTRDELLIKFKMTDTTRNIINGKKL